MLARKAKDPILCVGLTASGYNETRNIKSALPGGVEAVDVTDRIEVLKKIWHRMSGTSYSMPLHSFSIPARSPATVIHTFNSVVLRDIPWITTYETTLPRATKLSMPLIRLAWRRIAGPYCLRALALSSCAHARMLDDLRENRAGVSESILSSIRSKLEVLHPPQETLVSIAEKDAFPGFVGPLRLAIIGHDFYRKGGLELLTAIDDLIGQGLDIRLAIGGKMTPGDYASRAGHQEVAQATGLIAKHSSRIEVLGNVSPGIVLDTLRESHVLCLPTWGETYGYSVLEGQAAGCPAITSDLRALPEINNEECGWLIPVPKLSNGDGDISTRQKRHVFRKCLVDGLIAAITEAYHNRTALRSKAIKSLQRVSQYHSHEAHARRLAKLYYSALGAPPRELSRKES